MYCAFIYPFLSNSVKAQVESLTHGHFPLLLFTSVLSSSYLPFVCLIFYSIQRPLYYPTCPISHCWPVTCSSNPRCLDDREFSTRWCLLLCSPVGRKLFLPFIDDDPLHSSFFLRYILTSSSFWPPSVSELFPYTIFSFTWFVYSSWGTAKLLMKYVTEAEVPN